MSFTCPKCSGILNMKYFDGGYWVANKEPVWTCSTCNIFYRTKQLKKNMCCA